MKNKIIFFLFWCYNLGESEIIIMKENYFIIHGSFSTPYSNWIPWLSEVLIQAGEDVIVPNFPIGVGKQNYTNWNALLEYYWKLGLIHENTAFIAHSIAPVFVSKFLVEHRITIKKFISVCGFNHYLGIDENYDAVNESMYFDELADVKNYCDNIICFYSDNDPYVPKNVEEEFANTIATECILLPGAGHINAESGYDTFAEIIPYL